MNHYYRIPRLGLQLVLGFADLRLAILGILWYSIKGGLIFLLSRSTFLLRPLKHGYTGIYGVPVLELRRMQQMFKCQKKAGKRSTPFPVSDAVKKFVFAAVSCLTTSKHCIDYCSSVELSCTLVASLRPTNSAANTDALVLLLPLINIPYAPLRNIWKWGIIRSLMTAWELEPPE